MQIIDHEYIFSASDLANFLECGHLTALDLLRLTDPANAPARTANGDEAALVQAHGFAHEEGYLARLEQSGRQVTKLTGLPDLATACTKTLEAMRRGDEVIYQAALRSGRFAGYADFLLRVPGASKLGDWHYEVLDTKLARSPKAKFLIQLCFYAELLADTQGVLPAHLHLVFGDGREQCFRTEDFRHYFRTLRERFLEAVTGKGGASYPDPVEHCDLCHWREACEARRAADDHLSLVANITRGQIRKLADAGITTLAGLAQLPADRMACLFMAPDTLARLRHQADLQYRKRTSGQDIVELLPVADGKGLARLPLPDAGDLFFDMEGDPYEAGGLEYLFGVGYLEDGAFRFMAFWAHSRDDERRAFEDFVDFATRRLSEHPGAHIYHYAPYEETALKRLMCLHGTREAEIDHLLRTGKLVDLYKVVREGLRTSEPRYSIKNLETFYAEKRSGEVKNAGASIVWYERWKETGDEQLLEDIRAYNEDDCRSTWQLRDWLLTHRPAGMPWAQPPASKEENDDSARDNPVDLLLEEYCEALVGALPDDRGIWTDQDRARELACQLLDFHRREDKPKWWAMFDRMERSEEELLEDAECIAGLTPDPSHPPRPDKRSVIHTYRYPEQEFKLKPGDHVTDAGTGEPLNTIISLDEDTRRLTLRIGASRTLPDRLSLAPGQPIDNKVLRKALIRFADGIIGTRTAYPALKTLLNREPPKFAGRPPGQPVIDESRELLPQVIDAVAALDGSTLFIQGPPGAGKTWTGSHVIVAMLERKLRIGVASNSHKAINNLLAAVEKVADRQGIAFSGAKKCTGEADEFDGRQIRNVRRADDIAGNDQLVAGTAWLFADERFDQAFDILFVDEAGQVALANLVAMGTCARNLVLLGDPMQLGQPTQGTHPDESGLSGLEYLLDGSATVAPDKGIFLPITWRMAPAVCTFISEMVYDGHLHPEDSARNQHLELADLADPAIKPAGISFVPVAHDGCSQRSEDEAARIANLYADLLRHRYIDGEGNGHPIGPGDILVVAPYNMQVNLLRKTLPPGARVGTVDKFQGQEAPVVIVSMATSSGEELPRNLEFLFSKNRLNVAISRAKCLALVVASPQLTAVKCANVEQMKLVNLLCRIVTEHAP